jgi:CheY-like chemotaxis protein
VSVEIDDTPCIIEAHFNDEIMFIEIAQGLNTEKIELLKYKIAELLNLYDVDVPRVLIMLSSVELAEKDSEKMAALLTTVLETGRTKGKYMKILTNSPFIGKFISSRPEFADIGVTDNLNSAMDDLLGLKPDSIAHDEVVQNKLLRATAPREGQEGKESFQLRFEEEQKTSPVEKLENIGTRKVSIAIVDDDIVIQELVKTIFSETEWEAVVYENGKKFVEDVENHTYDLVFLDLMMPEMNGFEVLQYVRSKKLEIPIIVFSALSHKETVVKAVSFGVHSYLIKPLKPEQIMQKAVEILGRNF